MKTMPSQVARRIACKKVGFTLIEVVGVLAVLAILASVVLTALTKQTDKAVADQESATLRAFSDGLQRAILRRSYIPGNSDWAATIGAEVALNVSEVVTNARHQLRQFIIDPNFFIGNGSLPYQQDVNGSPSSPTAPHNLRFMILSSLGPSLPNNLVDTINKNPADFVSIWNTPDGQRPPLGTISFQGWSGSGDDLKIQRTDISGLLVHLLLSYTASVSPAYYSINGSVKTNPPVDSYFLQNSVLGLYTGSPNNLDSQQILVRDTSFVYFQEGWRSTAAQSPIAIKPFFIGKFDPGAVAASFYALPAPAQTQLTNFMAYLNAYNNWAALNFPDDTNYTSALDAYSNVVSGFGP